MTGLSIIQRRQQAEPQHQWWIATLSLSRKKHQSIKRRWLCVGIQSSVVNVVVIAVTDLQLLSLMAAVGVVQPAGQPWAGGAVTHRPAGTEGMCLDGIEPPELRIELQPPTEQQSKRDALHRPARHGPIIQFKLIPAAQNADYFNDAIKAQHIEIKIIPWGAIN